MKTKDILLVVVFAVSLLVLMIGVMIGSRASPPLSVGAVPAVQMPAAGAKAAAPAALAHQGGARGRRDYHPPAP